MPFSSGRSVRAPASNAISSVTARVPSMPILYSGMPFGSTVCAIEAIAAETVAPLVPPGSNATCYRRKLSAGLTKVLQLRLQEPWQGTSVGPGRYPAATHGYPRRHAPNPAPDRRHARLESGQRTAYPYRTDELAAAEAGRSGDHGQAQEPRRGRPVGSARDRVPGCLEGVPERRRRSRSGDILDRSGRVRVPGRLHWLGEVDRHAAADQGARPE